jgi:hypothetical protein
LAGAWRQALENEETRRTDAAAARRRVQTSFSLERMVRSYERLYVGSESQVGSGPAPARTL